MGTLTLSEGTEGDYKKLCDFVPEIFKIENYSQIRGNSKLKFITFKQDSELVGGSVYFVTEHRPDPENFPTNELIFFPAIGGEMFGIVPHYRGKGLGTEALHLRDKWVKERHDAVLIVTQAMNDKVLSWFLKNGYQLTSEGIPSIVPLELIKYFPDNYEKYLRKHHLI